MFVNLVKLEKSPEDLGLGRLRPRRSLLFATNSDNTSTSVDAGVTVASVAEVAIIGSTALPFVTAAGVIYGEWSFAVGSDWIDNYWG